jgi:hypothetical protein
MKPHQLKNYLVLGIILFLVFTIFSFVSLFTSVVIYSGFEQAKEYIKAYGLLDSFGIFFKLYKDLLIYKIEYSSQLDPATGTLLNKTIKFI